MGDSGIPVTGVSELVLEVIDLDDAERFYSEVLGLPVVERWPAREAVWLMAGKNTRIGLWKPQVGVANGRGGIHVHFAMHIDESDYRPAVDRLKSQGLEVQEEDFEETKSRACYITDPDGNVVELWTWEVARHLADL